MAKDYNLLTQRLLSEGYSFTNYPDYVKLPNPDCDETLFDIMGGFVYKPGTYREFIYKTGCGLLVKGGDTFHDMSYMGINWCHENFNPTVLCPYHCADCEKNNPKLRSEEPDGYRTLVFCECKRTEEEYSYSGSYNEQEDIKDARRKALYEEYCEKHGGRVCENHMDFDERTETWTQRYDPYKCVTRCHSTFCPIRGRDLSKKRGNVYYDICRSLMVDMGPLFEPEKKVHKEKGVRLLKKPVSIDICNAIVAMGKEPIEQKYYWDEVYSAKMLNSSFSHKIENVRALSRDSRDLLADIEDISQGIEVTHASDKERKFAEDKREHRKKLQAEKIKRLEKKLIEVGYYSLEEHSVDRAHADKWLTPDRIAELTDLHEAYLKEQESKPVQLRLF